MRFISDVYIKDKIDLCLLQRNELQNDKFVCLNYNKLQTYLFSACSFKVGQNLSLALVVFDKYIFNAKGIAK